jgi:hypothetical protein
MAERRDPGGKIFPYVSINQSFNSYACLHTGGLLFVHIIYKLSHMAATHNSLRSFFDQYARANHDMNASTIAGFYADNFIAAGPKGSMVFQNDEKFLQWLNQLKEFNQQTGMGNMQIVNFQESAISEHYHMVTIEWGVTFPKTGDELITFKISYFVNVTAPMPGIIMYISHVDQEDYMREKGLL